MSDIPDRKQLPMSSCMPIYIACYMALRTRVGQTCYLPRIWFYSGPRKVQFMQSDDQRSRDAFGHTAVLDLMWCRSPVLNETWKPAAH